MEKEINERYKIIKTIGTGGMGEVLLALDKVCKRKIALKKIKEKLKHKEIIRNRFLKEAKIASKLYHPSIIPIYEIHQTKDLIYYTMPYVEGKTLKELLKEANENTKLSIPYFMRIFLSICEAVAYIHSKNILHRDLKPENIIVGKYGQVLILDWGIAGFVNKKKEKETFFEEEEKVDLTRPGKISGTISFMAPEKAKGENSSTLSEIYSLGVILYKILTLSFPFKRINLAHFKKNVKREKFIDPIKKAPHRNIPIELSEIAKKCLFFEKEKRYQNVEDIIYDIKNYIEGKPRWILMKKLNFENKKDWDVNENMYLPKHIAITQTSELAQWLHVMLSKTAFSKKIKIETKISFKNSNGIGFLFSNFSDLKKFAIEEGLFLWLKKTHIQLIRSNVLIMEVNITKIEENRYHKIKIEKEKNTFKFFINDHLALFYVSHIPLSHTHFGLLYKDSNFDIKKIYIFSASFSAKVNCMAIPDAFLEKKDFDSAYEEYKKIIFSFPGRRESMEAQFNAAIVLLEKAKATKKKKLFNLALEEFEKLKNTPAAPLEYFGKSIVYAALLEHEEEAKCLELSIRKFSKHPLFSILKEHLIYRIHESSLKDRFLAFRLVLLSLLLIDSIKKQKETKILLRSLENHLEKLYFIKPCEKYLEIDLAFRLNRKQTILEILSTTNDKKSLENGYFALLELKEIETLKSILNKKNEDFQNLITLSQNFDENVLDKNFKNLSKTKLIYLIRRALDENKIHFLDKIFQKMDKTTIKEKEFYPLYIWNLLLKKEFDKLEKIFQNISDDLLKNEHFSLFFLYGIFLYTKDKEIAKAHFASILETRYPKTSCLLSYYFSKKIKKWFKEDGLYFEKKELLRQLNLFYRTIGNEKKADEFKKLISQKEEDLEFKKIVKKFLN